ncbi:UNVERIFIED_CONTAM: LIM domain-containing protein WLIM2b [Sesamum angustifolium]|uniref:LIM domain-containing protein WLIM2b n=1 Tax=Sesamum angustifolium TaxID=2727405 RepID=A0AAW2LDL5_9LAMI
MSHILVLVTFTYIRGHLHFSSAEQYSSMEGVLYCKPHYEQLFKETGSFSKNFQSPAKSAEKLTPELVTVESQSYHKSCFKCSHGGCSLTPSNYAALDGILYCKPHFSQLFKEKGSYNHLIKSASMKRATTVVPDS